MKNKLLFTFALITTIVLHTYVLQTAEIKPVMIAMKPQEKVSPIINLQRVAIKEPKPIVEPIKEVHPEPLEPVVEEVLVVPPKIVKKKAIKKVVKQKKIIKKMVEKKVIKKKKRKKVAKTPAKTQRSAPKQKAIKNAYLAKVRSIIEQRKKYPKSAKRMKQQGTAHIKFTISSNGKIRHISLGKKCPFSKLNKAAINILKKIGAFAPIPKELNETYLSLTVPIKYKILN